jgi:hypothetical protein
MSATNSNITILIERMKKPPQKFLTWGQAREHVKSRVGVAYGGNQKKRRKSEDMVGIPTN